MRLLVTLIATRQKDIDAAKRDSKRNVAFQRNGTLALPGGINTVQTVVTIKQGQSAASLQFSSHQTGSARIYAEKDRLVTGATLIAVIEKTGKAAATHADRMNDAAALFQQASFQLGSAMLGGLMFPLMLTAFPGKRREQRLAGGRLKMLSIYGVLGLFLGAIAFAVVFFGALGLSEFNFNGIPVTIARLPVHNWLAAIVIGFLGAAMLVKGIPFKGHAQEEHGDDPEGHQSGGGPSPAQA
ncbi:MAG TPA: hypothetical protein VK363_03395 [Pyrinomonadaceae bacterium]|nr:hypothetical protein [Pyrinomonadaceae bacterium]